jgi:hypothetical protein
MRVQSMVGKYGSPPDVCCQLESVFHIHNLLLAAVAAATALTCLFCSDMAAAAAAAEGPVAAGLPTCMLSSSIRPMLAVLLDVIRYIYPAIVQVAGVKQAAVVTCSELAAWQWPQQSCC